LIQLPHKPNQDVCIREFTVSIERHLAKNPRPLQGATVIQFALLRGLHYGRTSSFNADAPSERHSNDGIGAFYNLQAYL